MIYLLDTNTCIRYLNGRAPAIRTRLHQHSPQDIVVCSVVKAELWFGAQRSTNPARAFAAQQQFLSAFVSLPFDDRAAIEYARIRADLTAKGTLIGPNDLMIAAIARAHAVILVTHNTHEFQRIVGLHLEDWE
jgi:tRNA(fMet)-specific endonuclease VapC